MTVSQNCLGTQRKSNHLSRFGPHIHRKPTLVTTERCWVWRCPRAQPRDGPTGPPTSTLPAPARSYLQQEVAQVLVAIQEAENRCPELCGAPKGAFPFPGSPCWEVWVSLGTEACSMPQHLPPGQLSHGQGLSPPPSSTTGHRSTTQGPQPSAHVDVVAVGRPLAYEGFWPKPTPALPPAQHQGHRKGSRPGQWAAEGMGHWCWGGPGAQCRPRGRGAEGRDGISIPPFTSAVLQGAPRARRNPHLPSNSLSAPPPAPAITARPPNQPPRPAPPLAAAGGARLRLLAERIVGVVLSSLRHLGGGGGRRPPCWEGQSETGWGAPETWGCGTERRGRRARRGWVGLRLGDRRDLLQPKRLRDAMEAVREQPLPNAFPQEFWADPSWKAVAVSQAPAALQAAPGQRLLTAPFLPHPLCVWPSPAPPGRHVSRWHTGSGSSLRRGAMAARGQVNNRGGFPTARLFADVGNASARCHLWDRELIPHVCQPERIPAINITSRLLPRWFTSSCLLYLTPPCSIWEVSRVNAVCSGNWC